MTRREDATRTLHDRVVVAVERGAHAQAVSRLLVEEHARLERALRETCETVERRRRLGRPPQRP